VREFRDTYKREAHPTLWDEEHNMRKRTAHHEVGMS